VSSNLNLDTAGQTIANLVVVPVAAEGSITLYSQSGTHLIVDVLGYFTGANAASSTDGLFVPVTPARLLDTRDPANTPTPGPIVPGGTVTAAPLGRGDLPDTGVGALFLNVTITESQRAGYAQVYPTGGATVGSSSTVNVDGPDATRPNATFATLSAGGQFSIFDDAGGHVIADTAGWFTAPASTPVP
jgi:hypothetical protein